MFRSLLHLGPRGWWELMEAQWWLVWAAIVVRVRPRGRLVAAGIALAPPVPPLDHAPDVARRTGEAISRASRYGFIRPKCLVRSIALQRMLTRRGIGDARVRFGIRRSPGSFESHAWVECGGRVIADDPRHVRTFTPLNDLTLLMGREL